MGLARSGTTLLEEAVQAVGRGDHGLARSLLLRASDAAPTHDLVWLWLAQISTSPADKANYLRRVLDLHPGHEVARAGLADALRDEGVAAAKAGSKRRAGALLKSSIELDPNREDSWLWLAAVAETEAERRHYLAQVLAIDPSHRQALALLALLESRGEPKAVLAPSGEAASHLMEVLKAGFEASLRDLSELDGFVGACLVDGNRGTTIASEGVRALDLEAAAAGDAEVLNAARRTMGKAGSDDAIEDLSMTLDRHHHLIRPLAALEGSFLFLVLDRGRSNLALARHKLAVAEAGLGL